MTTATIYPDLKTNSLKSERAILQQRLRDRPKLLEQLDRARAEAAEAIRAVESFDRPPEYMKHFDDKLSRISMQISQLDNQVRQSLRNGCTDEALKREWHDARSAKSAASHDLELAKREIEEARHALEAWRMKLVSGHESECRGFGEPVVLNPGDRLPWSQNRLFQAASNLLSKGDEQQVLWAIQGDTIEFRPGAVGAKDIEANYKRGWFERYRKVAHCEERLKEAGKRMEAVTAAIEDLREKMVWSID